MRPEALHIVPGLSILWGLPGKQEWRGRKGPTKESRQVCSYLVLSSYKNGINTINWLLSFGLQNRVHVIFSIKGGEKVEEKGDREGEEGGEQRERQRDTEKKNREWTDMKREGLGDPCGPSPSETAGRRATGSSGACCVFWKEGSISSLSTPAQKPSLPCISFTPSFSHFCIILLHKTKFRTIVCSVNILHVSSPWVYLGFHLFVLFCIYSNQIYMGWLLPSRNCITQ